MSSRSTSSHFKAWVTLCGYFVAAAMIVTDAADIRYKSARFSIDVGAHVPRVGFDDQGLRRRLVVMLYPVVLELFGSFHDVFAVLDGKLNASGDPVHLLLQASGHVAKCSRRCQWRTGGEQVGVAMDLQPHRCTDFLFPLLPQRPVIAPSNVDPAECAGTCIETHGQHDNVYLVNLSKI